MPLQQSSSHKLKGFFLELVRKSFGQLGVGDNETTDYVASVLTEFSRSDRWEQAGFREPRFPCLRADTDPRDIGPQ